MMERPSELAGRSVVARVGAEVSLVESRAAVASVGVIGFVGLVVPHIVRLMLGPDHRWLLPGSALLGAALLSLADLATRLREPLSFYMSFYRWTVNWRQQRNASAFGTTLLEWAPAGQRRQR